jgi:MinD superfamily P-loop ATPase
VTRDIERFANEKGLTCLGRIPFDPVFTKAMVQAQTIFEYSNGSEAGHAIKGIWNNLSDELGL